MPRHVPTRDGMRSNCRVATCSDHVRRMLVPAWGRSLHVATLLWDWVVGTCRGMSAHARIFTDKQRHLLKQLKHIINQSDRYVSDISAVRNPMHRAIANVHRAEHSQSQSTSEVVPRNITHLSYIFSLLRFSLIFVYFALYFPRICRDRPKLVLR